MEEKKQLEVLSVDWDYFPLMDDKTRMRDFPRGHQHIDPEIQAEAWANCYMANKALKKHGVDEEAIEIVNEAILRSRITRATAALDHDSILELLPRDRTLNIYNVDYHHDSWPGYCGPRPDCENWVSFLHDQGRLNRYVWISKRQEQEPDPRDNPADFVERQPIETLKHVQFDLLFICLSPLWSPPHLDRHFYASLPIPPKFRKLAGNRWQNVRERIKEKQQAKG